MTFLLLLLACARPTDADCASAALKWVGEGGYVRECTHGVCVVTTRAGCDIELECGNDWPRAAPRVVRAYARPTVCR